MLGNIENSLNDIGDDKMLSEAVVHGEAMDLLHRENSPEEAQDKIRDLQERGVFEQRAALALVPCRFSQAYVSVDR